jgi:hypothetical protein
MNNELRIGNWVLSCSGGIETKVGIIAVGIEVPFEPIPLTEEWLLKFGFKKESDKSLTKNDIAIFLDKRFKTNLFLQENQDNFKWFSYECKIQYVHQIQNLYFALTGDELTIKNK